VGRPAKRASHAAIASWAGSWQPSWASNGRSDSGPASGAQLRRDAAAVRRFFRKALAQPHTVNPRTITVDKNAAYPRAVADMKRAGGLWRFSRLRQCKYLNNIVERDHRRIKRPVRPGLGFGSFRTAKRTLAAYEAMAMIRKGQLYNIGGRDMQAQVAFVAGLFQVAA